MEAAQRYLEAKERFPVGSEEWVQATAGAFDLLRTKECADAAKPEWWNDEGLKALSARVVRAAPNETIAIQMRAFVLSGGGGAWKRGPRSAAEFKEAAAHFDQSSAMCDAPGPKAETAHFAGLCRSAAETLAEEELRECDICDRRHYMLRRGCPRCRD